MKKALITTALAGFIRSFLEQDIKILQSMGYEVHCAANNFPYDEGIGQYFESLGVPFHQIDFSSNKPLSSKTVSSYYQFKSLIRKEKFDVVHIHTPITGVICRIACRKYRASGMKVFYTTHGFYFHKGSGCRTKLIYGTVEHIMAGLSDAIITINREDYEAAKKMRCSHVYYIPGVGVDLDRYRKTQISRQNYRNNLGIPADAFMILAVGELSERKNHRIVIEAIAESKIQNAVFAVCGRAITDDNTSEEMEDLAEKLGVDLRLLGYRKDIPEICKCADIGVLPSLREGLGLAGIEMLASGLPVIGSRVQGIVDYVKDGVNGFLADPRQSSEFAEGIRKLYDCETRRKMSANCADSVESFDIRRSRESIENIYREILSL